MKFNYSKICSDILKDLPERQRNVLIRRFGLKGGEKETLESIGRAFGITRERVRQIEEDGIKKSILKIKNYQKVFQYFKNYFKSKGGLRKEDMILEELGGSREQNQVYFLLHLSKDFERISESEEYFAFWTVDKGLLNTVTKIIDSVYNKLKRIKKPLPLREFKPENNITDYNLNQPSLASFLETSKKIQSNAENLFGLHDWPEINPRGVKDKAYLVFKKEGKPLHFNAVASLIDSALPQTVHNELIKDPRFVLVGRGVYALKEWGYQEGDVKDVILQVLKTNKNPLPKEKILDKVLEQRIVQKNTILLNLSNKKYFSRTPEGFYKINTKTA